MRDNLDASFEVCIQDVCGERGMGGEAVKCNRGTKLYHFERDML